MRSVERQRAVALNPRGHRAPAIVKGGEHVLARKQIIEVAAPERHLFPAAPRPTGPVLRMHGRKRIVLDTTVVRIASVDASIIVRDNTVPDGIYLRHSMQMHAPCACAQLQGRRSLRGHAGIVRVPPPIQRRRQCLELHFGNSHGGGAGHESSRVIEPRIRLRLERVADLAAVQPVVEMTKAIRMMRCRQINVPLVERLRRER